jgi:hypothetical protein
LPAEVVDESVTRLPAYRDDEQAAAKLMLLPAGTLSALKGQYDSIVFVVLALLAFTALAAGAPAWPTVGALALILVTFLNRRSSAERHIVEMAQQRVAEAAVRVEATKARHRELYMVGEPELDLRRPPRRLADTRPNDQGTAR